MVVFGGCSADGTQLADVFWLDLSSWEWRKQSTEGKVRNLPSSQVLPPKLNLFFSPVHTLFGVHHANILIEIQMAALSSLSFWSVVAA